MSVRMYRGGEMAIFSTAIQSAKLHVHPSSERCPTCDQPIPNDRLDEVNKRIAARDHQLRAEAEARVKMEVQAVRAQSAAALEALKAQLAAREEAARVEARSAALAESKDALVQAQSGKAVAEAKAAEAEAIKAETEKQMALLHAAQEETINA